MPDICAPHEVRMKIGKWAMLASIFKPIILWIAGGLVAAGVAGYAIVDSYNATDPAPEIVIEKEMPKAEKSTDVASLPKETVETKPDAVAKPAEQSSVASAPEPAPKHPLPKFDILRVETDGYAVIAGSAPAGSMVEILDGDTIIATEKAGTTNEFVVVLDKPLTPGSHDLIIRATLDGGKELLSAQAGIVNIPDGKSELLAMLTEPGKASKILQLPEPNQEASKQEASNETVSEVKVEAKEEAAKEMPKEVAKEAPIEAPKVEDQPAVEMAKKPEPATATTATPEPKIVEEVKKEDTQIASLEQQPKKETATAQPVIKPENKVEEPSKPTIPVLIQAAEVEGNKIFIAGTGQSGTSVHIYINGKFLGKTDVGAEGSYVFEGTGGLDAGRHAVRADMIGQESSDVLARAVVSLLHEPEAVASEKVAKAETKTAMAEVTVEKTADASSDPAETVSKPASAPTMEPDVKKEVAMAANPEEVKVSTSVVPPKQEPVKEPMKIAAVEEKVEMSSGTEMASKPKKMEMTQPATKVEKPAVKTGSTTKTDVAEITTGSSVIIRKGDSLWRVSQRRYGLGVRYTTIFDANRDQIRDPNLIYPGQVFEVPDFKEKS